jgi:hypothetical protein
MSRKKIADSIIIRVGGGIREISRQQVDMPKNPDAADQEAGFEQTEKMVPLGTERQAAKKRASEKPSAGSRSWCWRQVRPAFHRYIPFTARHNSREDKGPASPAGLFLLVPQEGVAGR